MCCLLVYILYLIQLLFWFKSRNVDITVFACLLSNKVTENSQNDPLFVLKLFLQTLKTYSIKPVELALHVHISSKTVSNYGL